MTLVEERRELEEERRNLDLEKKEFFRKVEIEDRRLEQQKSLFEMKFQILEAELIKLAAEKEQIARQRDFYRYVSEYQNNIAEETKVVKGEMFFCGVDSEDALPPGVCTRIYWIKKSIIFCSRQIGLQEKEICIFYHRILCFY